MERVAVLCDVYPVYFVELNFGRVLFHLTLLKLFNYQNFGSHYCCHVLVLITYVKEFFSIQIQNKKIQIRFLAQHQEYNDHLLFRLECFYFAAVITKRYCSSFVCVYSLNFIITCVLFGVVVVVELQRLPHSLPLNSLYFFIIII